MMKPVEGSIFWESNRQIFMAYIGGTWIELFNDDGKMKTQKVADYVLFTEGSNFNKNQIPMERYSMRLSFTGAGMQNAVGCEIHGGPHNVKDLPKNWFTVNG